MNSQSKLTKYRASSVNQSKQRKLFYNRVPCVSITFGVDSNDKGQFQTEIEDKISRKETIRPHSGIYYGNILITVNLTLPRLFRSKTHRNSLFNCHVSLKNSWSTEFTPSMRSV